MSRLSLEPCSIREAKRFVARFHRHHKPPQGALFALAAAKEGEIIGVAIVGRPVARMLQDGYTAEVTRVATDGTRNACSFLYNAAYAAAAKLGYRRVITYTLESEGGSSLRGAGWREVGLRGGGTWNRPNRTRLDKHPLGQKVLWEREPLS